MATAGDGIAPYEIGGGTEEKLRKRPSRPGLNEEPQNVSQEAVRNKDLTGESEVSTHQGGNPASISVTDIVGISELEPILKQVSFTRSEASTLGSLKQMASRPHPTTIENLPDELLLNIFIRLFSKQIAQLRSVSKPWNALLSQSSFIKSHLHRSIHNNDQILLVFYQDTSFCDCETFTAHLSRCPYLELTGFNKLPPVNPISGRTNTIRIIGAVDGLICSSYSSDSIIHIWNPSLSAVLTLPPSPSPSQDLDKINLRFGFDPKNDDYKVLKILIATDIIDISTCTFRMRKQVEVFSMRKGSWEEITKWYPSHIHGISCHNGVCVDGHDGHLHWLGHCTVEKRHTNTIVTFDLGSHTFSEIPFPDSMRDHYTKNILGVLAKKLCVISWDKYLGCEVWVMDEYGAPESWVKRHVFSQFNNFTFPYGFTSHNEFLYEDDDLFEDNRQLVLYDPNANKTKNFEKFHCYVPHHPRTIVEYVDSLVWVVPTKYEMVDGGGQN